MSQTFQKRTENFICAQCGASVVGTGYTNHCPKCLWSKHVDSNPGDRAHDCGGLMMPIGIELDHGETMIIHQCQQCGVKKRNKKQPADNADKLISLSTRHRV